MTDSTRVIDPRCTDDGPATIGPFLGHTRIAYFTMEIALRAEMHTYSGGLGVLAGDTARAAADLDLPMVFVTLISRAGYIRQEIDPDAGQQERADDWRPQDYATPLRAKVALLLEGREVWLRPWLYVLPSPAGGAIPVLLIDTDLAENAEPDRHITDHLYGGDERMRLKQEAVLGIGGLRLLQALGFSIQTYHQNEGHAALLALDLLRRYPRPPDQVGPRELHYDVAPVRRACLFTTHTPVEAGHDRFDYGLFGEVLPGYIELDQVRLLAGQDRLNMTRLALSLSGFINGVAVRHAHTTNRLFPGYSIRAITNGVHIPTWAHPAFAALFSRYSRSWAYEPVSMVVFDQLPDEEVWDAHMQAKGDLIEFVHEVAGVELDPALPIIGFARRMTAYKRPDLLFTDLERLQKLHAKRPFQLVFGGKAHPRDQGGKALIRRLLGLARDLAPEMRIAYVPNYDMGLAKTLVAGPDIWLNTPEPPLEASGTSGMKAAVNGVLNLSMLDGWWVEGCIEGATGWAIGVDRERGSHEDDAEALYDKLEQVVLPTWYDDRSRWIWMMKQSISKLSCYFNAHRMMRRYAAEAYIQRRPSPRSPQLPPD
jgi:glycogen phosphorylase